MNQAIKRQVVTIAEPLISEKGFELIDVEYIKEGAYWYLRLYIDKAGGVDLDDCAAVSRELSRRLDQEEFIAQAYILEVSSPGVERPLKSDADFERFTGHMVKIRTSAPIQNYKEFVGGLIGLADACVILEYEDERISIPRDLILQANLYVEF